MKIWLINHYAVPPQYYPLARPSLFAKNLIKMGHDVTIIAASTVHNSDCQNLIEDGSKVKHITDDGIPYVLINCKSYKGNGKDRVINILQFARRLPKVLDALEKPDAIVATSFDPLSCWEGIKYAKKQGIKAVAEIADLWPETLVSYNVMSPYNPIVRYLRTVEKNIYTKADVIVFTMEGAYDYIRERGWERDVPKEKVHFINNGVDLETYNHNKDKFFVEDSDLQDPSLFKIVYTGSIRKANNIGRLLDIAQFVKNRKVRFLIWGDGSELQMLKQRVEDENISNVVFKGRVEKKFISSITSRADLNIMHGDPNPILRFGLSANKLFDYLAAGKPILTDFPCKYNPAEKYHVSLPAEDLSVEGIAALIDRYASLNKEKLVEMGENASLAARDYDFKKLTADLMKLL